ncbi:hypothetical protein ABTF77_20750, partial [Acinetobacter baumannii]
TGCPRTAGECERNPAHHCAGMAAMEADTTRAHESGQPGCAAVSRGNTAAGRRPARLASWCTGRDPAAPRTGSYRPAAAATAAGWQRHG